MSKENDELMKLVNEVVNNDPGKFLKEQVFNSTMKKRIVEGLNDHIDIPFISEKTEGKCISAILEVVEDVILKEFNVYDA